MSTRLCHLYPIEATSRSVDLVLSDRQVASRAATTASNQVQHPARARWAMPGFVNAHTHLPMVIFRGLAEDVPLQTWLTEHIWPLEQRLDSDDVYWCTLLALSEGIRSGTTTFIDMYFHCDAIARAVEESGARALLAYGMVAPSLDGGGRQELARAAQLIDDWHGRADGRIRVAIAPHAVYTCGEDVWREAIRMADRQNVPLHTHLAETRTEVEDWRARTGMTPVEHLHRLGAFAVPLIAAHCVHVSSDDIALLAHPHVTVVHCPKSNAKLGSGIAPVPAMLAAGVRVALGTDGSASNNRLDMIEELRAAWVLQRGAHQDPTTLLSHTAVDMAVQAGRVAAGLPCHGLVGGAPADVVVIEGEPPRGDHLHEGASRIAYDVAAADVTDVYIDGKPILQRGELQTIDEDRVRAEVRRRLHRIKHR